MSELGPQGGPKRTFNIKYFGGVIDAQDLVKIDGAPLFDENHLVRVYVLAIETIADSLADEVPGEDALTKVAVTRFYEYTPLGGLARFAR